MPQIPGSLVGSCLDVCFVPFPKFPNGNKLKLSTVIAGFLLLFLFCFVLSLFCFVLVCCLFSRAAPTAYGRSQTRGLIGAVAASLCHSHSNTGSELRLQPTPQLTAMPNP